MSGGRAGTWLAGTVLLLLVGASTFRPGPLPRIGPFLDPVHGIWSVAGSADLPAADSVDVAGLGVPVEVRTDSRGVPHVFAATELDALRALGYLVARDRLFQLELQWRAGAGRLTELVGARALTIDRETRALGLADAAERRFAAYAPGSPERAALEAFSAGVNARIDALTRRDIPFEYHLLDRRPARWQPVYSLYLLGRMGWTLAYSDLEATTARARALVGAAASDALYPRESPIQEPIQPAGRRAPREVPGPLPPPCAADACATALAPAAGPLLPARRLLEPDAIGSNSWAVAPARSASGHALLAGDPHLELTLPSIWYEVHLVVADSLDVHGVTIPGAMGVVIGFTPDVAWTFTNAEADVLDRYAEVVDDPRAPTRYQVDGAWEALRIAPQEYRDGAGRRLAADTLRFTHRGPLLRQADGGWQSLRWTVLEPGNELLAFAHAARARTAGAWLDSMAGYAAPAQNMLVADRQGTIAIRTTGRFPLRPSGRGDLLQQGARSASDWVGAWTLGELPQALAPAQGYLASANQQPIDPLVEPRYLGANWYSPWRALRINALLRADSAVTPDAMRRYQTDPGSAAADRFVPAFLHAATHSLDRDSVALAARLLSRWDRRYTPDNTGAVLYEAALRELAARLWDELEPARTRGEVPSPGQVVIARLLGDSASPWWDDRRTPGIVETRDRLLADALAAALGEVTRRHGNPDGDGWRWDRIRFASINHVLYLPGLSERRVPVQGGQGTLNPSSGSGSFGASWRMVVELGPEVRAWSTYPGGQSGNPASARYADRIPQWSAGQLDSIQRPRRADEVRGTIARLRLSPAGRD